MLSNNYKKAIEPLRSHEVQPSFDEIRSMVLHQKGSRRFLPIPFWLYLSASAPILVALSMFLFPEMYGLQRSTASSIMPAKQIISAEVLPQPQSSFANRQSVIIKSQIPIATVDGNLKMNDDRRLTIDNRDNRKTTVENQQIKNDEKQQSPIADPQPPVAITNESQKTNDDRRSTIDDKRSTNDDKNKLSLFISGGLPPAQSSLAFADRLNGSIGIQYHVNSASSVIFELRRNAFIQKYDAQRTTFRDTILTVGSQSYHSTIGTLTAFRAESPNDLFSAGIGYRYIFTESGSFHPFAEVLFGGAAQGALASELAGIEYSFGSPFSFEFALRTDQLFSKGSSPGTAFNMNAGLSYSW